MEYDLAGIEGAWTAAGNLPYYITTPIVMKIIGSGNLPERMVFMTQKEAAERIAASPGSKAYGAVSVLVQRFCRTDYAFTVGPEVFHPRPHVDSAIIVLTPDESLHTAPKSEDMFTKVVKTAFSQRRKMLRNPLAQLLPDKGALARAFGSAGIAETARAEQLSVDDFIALSDSFMEAMR
jgi:16S rRNA (adenine1518-N6/adenine1519-N6)-dimethyltransferase